MSREGRCCASLGPWALQGLLSAALASFRPDHLTYFFPSGRSKCSGWRAAHRGSMAESVSGGPKADFTEWRFVSSWSMAYLFLKPFLSPQLYHGSYILYTFRLQCPYFVPCLYYLTYKRFQLFRNCLVVLLTYFASIMFDVHSKQMSGPCHTCVASLI